MRGNSFCGMKQIRYCKLCGDVITTKNNNYCSVKCFNMDRGRKTYTCKFCGVSFTPKAANRTIYCSRDCYFAEKTEQRLERERDKPDSIKYGHCKICNSIFVKIHSREYCSDECRKEKERRRSFISNSLNKQMVKKICKECGKEFILDYGDKRSTFCSKKCSGKHSRRGKNKNRKKARKYGVKYEPVNPISVFERDGWHCQICGKKTPKKHRGTLYSNAPELDHRVPISKGGHHLYTNVQCACRQCNCKKSNKKSIGQLPLFGVGAIF